MSAARRYAAPLAVILVLLGAWELAARWDLISNALNIEDFLVPAPSDIAQSLWQDRSLLADDSWVTLREVLLGFLCALAAGLAFAVILHLSDTLRRAFYPLLVASQTIPPVAIAPILVVWFGFGLGPKVLSDRPGLLLPRHGEHARWASLGRPAADHDDADAGGRARPDPGQGRAALGSPLLLQRDEDRDRGRRDRGGLRGMGRRRVAASGIRS